MLKRHISAIALSTLGLALLAGPASAGHEGSVYTGNLSGLNGVNGSGSVSITVADDGESIAVDLDASGLADFPHAIHIHGIVDGEDVSASACPPAAADEDGDGIITVVEGAPFYGGVQLSLTTEGDTSADSALAVERFPAGSSISYSRSGIDLPDNLKPNIAKLHVVVHGVDENGDGELNMDQQERSSLTDDLPREATAPALCGTLTAQAATVQTGLGGTADTGMNGFALAGGLIALAGAGTLTRRRGEQA